MSLWNEAHKDANKIEEQWGDSLDVDQQLKLAEVKALLAIGQELSGIRHAGINPEYQSR